MTFILYFLWAYKVFCSLIHLDTKASERVTSLITNSALCKDICRLSPNYQTSSLESFHNIIIHFASKSTALLRKEKGNFRLCSQNARKEGYIVKKVIEKATYGKKTINKYNYFA